MSIFGDIMGYINSGRAAKAVSDADIAAEHGVLGATASGQAGVSAANTFAQDEMNHAGTMAVDSVNNATAGANNTLQGVRDQIGAATDPYRAAGAAGAARLMDYAASNPQFKFNLDDYFNSPAYQFQLEQGKNAIQNTMSASGLASSGAALKELTQFGQGLAANYYNDAFNRAKSAFDTNHQATMQILGTELGAGEFGTGQYNAANTALGGEQAQNTANAGYYAGNTAMTVGELLSKLGVNTSEFNANLGLSGAKMAGDYAVDAGLAHAGGILSRGQAMTGLVNDAIGLASPMAGSIPLGGGNATTLAGIFGAH